MEMYWGFQEKKRKSNTKTKTYFILLNNNIYNTFILII